MAVGLAQANLIGVLLELIFYGSYVTVFKEHIHVLYKRRSKTWAYVYIQTTGILLFILITMHVCLDLVRTIQAFTDNMGTPDAPTIYFNVLNTGISRFRTALYTVITLISDLFIVYRCFVVWSYKYTVAFIPFILFITDIVMVAWSMVALNEARTGSNFALTQVGLRSKYLFAITLAENLLCTVLIAYKIWRVQRGVSTLSLLSGSGRRQRHLSQVMIIIIESAAIYSAILVGLIITECIESPSYFLLLNMLPPIIGIVFSLIIVRCGTASAGGDTTQHISVSAFKYNHNISKGSTTADDSANSGKTSNNGVHVELEVLSQPSYGVNSQLEYETQKVGPGSV